MTKRINATLKIRNIPVDSLEAIIELIHAEAGAKVAVSDQFNTRENVAGPDR